MDQIIPVEDHLGKAKHSYYDPVESPKISCLNESNQSK